MTGSMQPNEPLLAQTGKPQQRSMPLRLYLTVLWALPGAFQFGYASGVINDPEQSIKDTLGISTNQFALVVAIFAVGGAFGTPLAGKLADRYGRRMFLWLHSIVFLVAGLLEAFCPNLPAPWAWLIVARVLIGFAAGGASVVVPLYIGEVAPQSQRGALTSLNQFAVTVAILISEIAGQFMSNNPGWRYLLGGTAAVAVFQLITAPFLPESPKFLVARNQPNDLQHAKQVLIKLRACPEEEADEEVRSMREEMSNDGVNVEKRSVMDVFRAKELRLQLFILFTLHASQQLSGINAVFYYSTTFFKDAGISNGALATLLIGTVNVLATGLGVYLMERTGRRPLIVYGAFTMLIASLGLTVMLALNKYHEGNAATGVFAVIFIMVFVTGFEVGLGPIPWAIGTEVFSEDARATAMGMGASLNWFCNFLVGYFFPSMQTALGPFSFLPFSFVLLCCFLVTSKWFVETKGRSVDEVQSLYQGNNKYSGKRNGSAMESPASLKSAQILQGDP